MCQGNPPGTKRKSPLVQSIIIERYRSIDMQVKPFSLIERSALLFEIEKKNRKSSSWLSRIQHLRERVMGDIL